MVGGQNASQQSIVPRLVLPRCVRRRDIERAYGLKPAAFSRLVAKGIMPPRVPGTRMWDRRAIEHALDKLAGLNHSARDNESEADRWFRENGAHESAA
jgi:hypothetical protein